MLTEAFDYILPEELIAHHPPTVRGTSRLLALERTAESTNTSLRDMNFPDIKGLLRRGDLLVLNDTRVIPARLIGKKVTGGVIELFLIRHITQEGGPDDRVLWKAFIKGRAVKVGLRILFDEGLVAEAVRGEGDGLWIVALSGPGGSAGPGDIAKLINRIGKMPLPPYIKRGTEEEDRERYQTVFAAKDGAVAAPTAGLHFTKSLLDEIENAGVETVRLTLHTGPGTFLPVRAERLEEHVMHSEEYFIEEETFAKLLKTRAEGRRVVAVGSTSTRALEASVQDGFDRPRLSGETDIFIYPGYDFKMVDAMITNFHLPKSTLLMMVAAFAGRERILEAYREAVKRRYRFYSYGDAMFIN